MNVHSEVKALSTLVDSLPERAKRGEFTPEEIPAVVRYLEGRLTLIKRHIATDEFARFQKIIETSYFPRGAG
jgi:hypothetical protein